MYSTPPLHPSALPSLSLVSTTITTMLIISSNVIPHLSFTSSSHFISSLISFLLASFIALYALQNPSQAKRWALLPLLFLFTASAFSVIIYLPLHHDFGLMVGLGMGQYLIIWFANITQLLFITQYHVPSSNPTSPWVSAYKVFYNSRRIPKRSVQPVHGVEKTTQFDFFKTQCLKIAMAILITTLLSTLTEPFCNLLVRHLTLPAVSLLEQRSFIRRLNQVNTFEVILRSFSVLEFVAGTWAMCTFFHSIFSLLFICILQIDEPDEWPALFGSLTETYSLRMFWGMFWHRLVCSIWLELAKFIIAIFPSKKGKKNLPTSRGGLDRIIITGLVFLFSGLNHGFVAWSQGFTCGWWEEINTYLLNFCAIVAEDLLKSQFRKMGGEKMLSLRTKRVIGYFWTWGFLFWCVPKVQYTKSMCLPPGFEL